jgi:hypothetical protein
MLQGGRSGNKSRPAMNSSSAAKILFDEPRAVGHFVEYLLASRRADSVTSPAAF